MAYILTVIYVALSYLRPAEQFNELAPYRIMLWIGLAAAIAAACTYSLRGRWRFQSREVFLVIAFTGAIVLSRIAAGWFGGAVDALAEFGITASVFLCIVVTVNSMTRIRVLAVTLVLTLLVIVAQAVVVYHYGDEESVFVLNQNAGSDGDAPEGGSAIRRIRGVGFLNDPNDLGQALVMTLPLIALAWQRGRHLRNLLLVAVPSAVFLYGIFLTHSRGAVLSMLVLVLVAARRRFGTTKGALAALVLVAVALASGAGGGRGVSTDESVEGRFDAWNSGLQMLRGNPVFGVGYNSFTDNNELTAHNSFVLCFAELGLAGYFIWISLLGMSHLELRNLESSTSISDGDVRRWARALHLSLYSFLAAACFLSRTYNLGLFILLGMGAALVEISAAQTEPAAVPRFWFVAPRAAAFEVASIFAVYALMRVRHL